MSTSLPLGYRFRPTDRELLFYFLKNKLKDPTTFQPAAPIFDIQLYDHHPQIILDQFGVQGHNNNNVECYVFTMRHRKHLRGTRPNRGLKDNVGYWRASYNHGDEFQERSSRRCGGEGLVGERMNLVFYDTTSTTSSSNKKKGTKTDWLMNEYRIKPAAGDDNGTEEDLVLCRIYLNNRKRNKGSNQQQQQQEQYIQQEQPYLQQQQQQQYIQQEQPYLQQQQQQQQQQHYMQQELPYLQQQQEQPYLQHQQQQYMQEEEQLTEQAYLQQQQQEQQPAAVDDQASNTGTCSNIDTEIDVDTLWELMNQEPEQQQTGAGMISIDDYV